eukprot:3762944-Amphidinium_carterae.1
MALPIPCGYAEPESAAALIYIGMLLVKAMITIDSLLMAAVRFRHPLFLSIDECRFRERLPHRHTEQGHLLSSSSREVQCFSARPAEWSLVVRHVHSSAFVAMSRSGWFAADIVEICGRNTSTENCHGACARDTFKISF